MSKQNIQFDKIRDTVQIHLADGRAISGPRNSKVGDFLRPLEDEKGIPIVGAIVNKELRELTHPIAMDSFVKPVTMAKTDGMRIYRRSLTYLLEAAFHSIYPDMKLSIDHSVFSGGYYCQIEGRKALDDSELENLEKKMKEFVERDLPFDRKQIPLQDAIELFEKRGMQDKVRLLHHRKKNYLVLYELDGYLEYHHGYMLPSTGGLKWFGLSAINGGFTLRFPRRQSPTSLLEIDTKAQILDAFRDYGEILSLLKIDSVGLLNDAIVDGRIREIILVTEALHEQQVAKVAAKIAENAEDVRVVLVAGPSSSGKTTFSKRLSVQLLASGFSPFALEMDRFFVDREQTPKDRKGEFDFEHIDAVNRDRLNHDIGKLIAGKETKLPIFNFLTGKSEEGETQKLKSDQIIIIEGIHGLNPELLADFSDEQTFRIYLSALTQLNLDRHNRVSTTDTRLVRRIVRDARERGHSPQSTIQRWESVRRGEKFNIFPYQGNADVVFNSALVYELAALKPLAEPLLRQVPVGSPEHIEVKRLLALLEWFVPLENDFIPDNSLLREFIGGSILSDFSLWSNEEED
jgi:uridine kinase